MAAFLRHDSPKYKITGFNFYRFRLYGTMYDGDPDAVIANI